MISLFCFKSSNLTLYSSYDCFESTLMAWSSSIGYLASSSASLELMDRLPNESAFYPLILLMISLIRLKILEIWSFSSRYSSRERRYYSNYWHQSSKSVVSKNYNFSLILAKKYLNEHFFLIYNPNDIYFLNYFSVIFSSSIYLFYIFN
jgi:hypothetical protein